MSGRGMVENGVSLDLNKSFHGCGKRHPRDTDPVEGCMLGLGVALR